MRTTKPITMRRMSEDRMKRKLDLKFGLLAILIPIFGFFLDYRLLFISEHSMGIRILATLLFSIPLVLAELVCLSALWDYYEN